MPTLVTIDLDELGWTHQAAADLIDDYAQRTGSSLLAHIRDEILAQKPTTEPFDFAAVVADCDGDLWVRAGTPEAPWLVDGMTNYKAARPWETLDRDYGPMTLVFEGMIEDEAE